MHFQMVCRDLQCVDEKYLAIADVCLAKPNVNNQTCYLMYVRLTVWRERTLPKNAFNQLSFLEDLQNFVADSLSANNVIAMQFFKPQWNSTYKYLIVRFIVDHKGYGAITHIIDNLDCTGIRIANIPFQSCEFAIYNSEEGSESSIYVPANVYAPHLLPKNVEIANEFYSIKPQNNNGMCDKLKPFSKIHLCPFIEIKLSEYNARVEKQSGILIIRNGNSQFWFYKWQYEQHGDNLYICLNDYFPLYDDMSFQLYVNVESRGGCSKRDLKITVLLVIVSLMIRQMHFIQFLIKLSFNLG